MKDNPYWGVLNFALDSEEVELVEDDRANNWRKMKVDDRISAAYDLGADRFSYRKAFELGCWISRSKKGGFVLVECMDLSYLQNTLKMVVEERHPIIGRDELLIRDFKALFEAEIARRNTE